MRKLRLRHESWPIAGRFTISRGSKTSAEVIVVEIEEQGALGRGECVPYSHYGESLASVMDLLAGVAGAIEGGLAREELQGALPAGAARNALDCALWDLEAKLSSRPVWALAGLAPPQPVTTAYTLSLDTVEKMGEAAKANAARPLLKLKLAGADDLDRVRAVRRNAPGARLIVDANEGWNAADHAELAPRLAELGVALIEQPLPAGGDEALAACLHPVPLCADECCHDRASLAGVIGRYEAVNIKLDKTGGLTEALALRREAQGAGLRIMVGCMLGTSLAMAPALLLAEGADFVDLDGPLLLARDRSPGLVYAGSRVEPAAPRALGLGPNRMGVKNAMLRKAGMLIVLASLAGCAGPATCPATLAYVKDRLVTPYPTLEDFIGKDAMDSTFEKPVDQMITESGGIEASIAGGEKHVAEYQAVLQDEPETRAQYRKDGKTDEWIDTYFLSVQDGVLINQAFVDAVKCRQAKLQEQSQPAPAG